MSLKRSILFVLAPFLFASAAIAQNAPPPPAPGSPAAELQQLREELTALRLELAQTKLELNETLRELNTIRQFLETENAQEDIARWQAQRAAWEAEREKLAAERRELDAARRAIRQGGMAQPLAPPASQQPAADPATQPRWEIDYKIAPISTDANQQIGYLEPIGGDIILRDFDSIDRKHIMIRGTWQNRSAAPWRYTFEIRIGDPYKRIIGRWRYQTPVLGANELHEFEVKVPVADVGLIRTYQIGNIEPDQPAEAKAAAATKPQGG